MGMFLAWALWGHLRGARYKEERFLDGRRRGFRVCESERTVSCYLWEGEARIFFMICEMSSLFQQLLLT